MSPGGFRCANGPGGVPDAPQFRAPSAPASVSLSVWVSKSINNLYHLVHSRRESPYVPVSPYRGPALTRDFPPRSSGSAAISRYPVCNGCTSELTDLMLISRNDWRTGVNGIYT